jgi:SnoaL-like domain
MMRDYDRLASLFTHDGAVRMPDVRIELAGREEIAPGTPAYAGSLGLLHANHAPGQDPAGGRHRVRRAYMSELIHGRDGSSHLNYFVYHDRYQRTGERRTPGGRQRSCLS